MNYYESQPYELIYKMALNLSIQDIVEQCRVSRKFNQVCENENFWKDYGVKKYNLNYNTTTRDIIYLIDHFLYFSQTS